VARPPPPSTKEPDERTRFKECNPERAAQGHPIRGTIPGIAPGYTRTAYANDAHLDLAIHKPKVRELLGNNYDESAWAPAVAEFIAQEVLEPVL